MNKLVIFDCDGVLVDSENLANQALIDYLTELDIKISFSDALRRFKGRSMKECMDQIEEMSNQVLPEKFEVTFRQRMDLAFEKNLKAISGIEAALKNIFYPICVASNGPIQKTSKSLSLVGLQKYFGENIFSSHTIQKWKPEPDLFLHACQSMGATPKQCIVVEDSILGVQAAMKAEMRILHYIDDCKPLADFDGYLPFKEMRDLPSLIDTI